MSIGRQPALDRLKIFLQRNPFTSRLFSWAFFGWTYPRYRSLRKRVPSLSVRPGTADPFVFFEVFSQREYAAGIGALPRNASVIVDVGANVGYATLFFALSRPDSAIFAIELEPSNFERLRENTHCLENVTCIHAGIWHTQERLKVVDPDLGHWGFSAETASDDDADSVAALTIDAFLTQHDIDRIDLLKIDIEGAEKELFSHDTAWMRRVGALMVELHDRFVPGCTDAVRSAGERYGFRGELSGGTMFLTRTP